MQATENVVELMLRKFSSFPDTTQDTLKLAACLGNTFEIVTLAVISRQTREKTFSALQPVLNIGMVVQTDESFRFVHDRVQEAAYALIPDEQKQMVHFEIGSLLLGNTSKESPINKIFDTANHLNISRDLLLDKEKRYELAGLNLTAGQHAKKNAAYAAALQYFNAGTDCLAGNSWDKQYELTFALYVELAEAEYLNSNFEQSQKLFNIVLEKARSAIEKSEIYSLLIYQYTVKAEYQEGIEAGRAALRLLGIDLPEKKLEQALNAEIKEAKKNLGTGISPR